MPRHQFASIALQPFTFSTMSKIENLEMLLETLPAYNVQPLWTVMDAVVSSQPVCKGLS